MTRTADEHAIQLCCLLWAHPGQVDSLRAYEDRVLAWVPEHGGDVVHRAVADGREGRPDEIQFFGFPNQAALEAFLADERRLALTAERDAAIARTELFPVRF